MKRNRVLGDILLTTLVCSSHITKGRRAAVKEIVRLYIEYKIDLYHYLLGLTHNKTVADDLLSDTFLKAITSFPTFRGESSIKTWLFGIARNLWLQHLKKEKLTTNIDEIHGITDHNDFMQEIALREMTSRVNVLLLERDSRCKEVFLMRMNGYSFRTIAEKLNISESTSRVIDFRTRKWLQTVLSREDFI
jgi:RNA polymerase sigma factor (sigma-70 family)